MSISEGTSWSVAQTSQRDGPDTLGVFYEVDVHFKELTDDLDIRRCMARQGSSPKSSRVGKRDRDQELVRKVAADRHPRRDIGTRLLRYFGRDRLGAHGHLSEPG